MINSLLFRVHQTEFYAIPQMPTCSLATSTKLTVEWSPHSFCSDYTLLCGPADLAIYFLTKTSKSHFYLLISNQIPNVFLCRNALFLFWKIRIRASRPDINPFTFRRNIEPPVCWVFRVLRPVCEANNHFKNRLKIVTVKK